MRRGAAHDLDVAGLFERPKRRDEVTVDLSGTAPMVRGALNATRSFTEATVYQAVMSAVSSQIPTTSGAFRPVNIVTTPGTVAHVVMPGASTMRGVPLQLGAVHTPMLAPNGV